MLSVFDFNCCTPSVPLSSPDYIYDFCSADYESMSLFLLGSDFSAVYSSANIESVWSSIKALIFKAIPLYTPKILIKQC